MNIKKLLASLCIFFVVISPVFATANNDKNISYLFVQSANHAHIKAIPNQPGTYLLTLKQVLPYVVYFSDRPNRITGILSNNKFSKLWQDGAESFAKVSPNASLVGENGKVFHDAKRVDYTIELTTLKYHPQKKSFTYIIHLLPNEAAKLPEQSDLGHVTLFIDGACLSCIGG